MKKITSVILIILLVLFAACSAAEAGRADRWNDETAVKFSIRLLKGAEKDAEGKVIEGKEAEDGFFDYPDKPGTQVKPDFIDGEYSYTVKYADGKWKLTQAVTVNETFKKENFDIFKTDGWKEAVKDASIYSEAEEEVTITTATQSEVVFNLFSKGGGAVSSVKTVKGVFVYIAKEDSQTKHEIWYNDYTVEVKYSEKKAETVFTDRVGNWDLPAEKTVSVAENVYDNEAFIFAVRALNLGKLPSGGETFNSYNGLVQSPQTIAVTAETKEYDGRADGMYRVMAGPDGQNYQYLLYFENSTADEKMVRVVNSTGGKVQGFELLKFSQGYMMFERA